MTQDKRYKIILQATNGWTLIDPSATNLTKEQCSQQLNRFMNEGHNPIDMKAVIVNDPRYPT